MTLPGLDLVLEGTAPERYASTGWPAEVRDGALAAPYSAPSAGPLPWHLYTMTLTTAYGVASAEPHGATRWQFD